jgi:ribonucleotide reductase alpha subunit
MGFAEMLIRLGILRFSKGGGIRGRLMTFIADAALRASQALAEERGTFANWQEAFGQSVVCACATPPSQPSRPQALWGFSRHHAEHRAAFALVYHRVNVLDGQTLAEVNPLWLESLERHGLKANEVVQQFSNEAASVTSR